MSPETLGLIRQRGITRVADNRELAKQFGKVIKNDLKEKRAVVMVETADAWRSTHKAH
ncbi:hypothetical protein Angca_000397, partial [Angiostrongylus cantonensis]